MPLAAQIPELGAKTDRPRLNPGADLTVQRLSPTEAFVLSRVDGTASYEEICLMSGLGVEPTLQILRRLKRDRLILGPRDPVPPPARSPLLTPPVGTPVPRADSQPPTTPLLERLDDGSPVDPKEIESGPDLPAELKARIVRLHRRMRRLGPHEMLGLPPGAGRAEIKRAYFAASKELHPDRYYGKDIGVFREKLGDIFARLTEAFQALDRK